MVNPFVSGRKKNAQATAINSHEPKKNQVPYAKEAKM